MKSEAGTSKATAGPTVSNTNTIPENVLTFFHLLRSSKPLLGKIQPRWYVVVTVSESTTLERMLVAFGKSNDVIQGFVRILMSRCTVEPSTFPATYQQQDC